VVFFFSYTPTSVDIPSKDMLESYFATDKSRTSLPNCWVLKSEHKLRVVQLINIITHCIWLDGQNMNSKSPLRDGVWC